MNGLNDGWTKTVGILAMGLLLGACVGDEDGGADEDGPRVTELSLDTVVVGETILVLGHGFRKGGADGVTHLTFEGRFVRDDGEAVDVRWTTAPLYDGTVVDGDDEFDVLRVSRFGPFAVPFEGVEGTGTFEGRIRAKNVLPDETVQEGPETGTFTLEVAPSIVIEEFQPIIADCGEPVLRGLGGLPYRMRVRVIGFTPSRFVYTATRINGQSGAVTFEHTASGPTDVLGEDEPFVLNPVDPSDSFHVTVIRVEAFDKEGRVVETVLPLSVHRPLEFFYDDNFQVAQYYPPVPVSGCIPGAIGNRVSYSESVTETKQRSLSVTVNSTWTRQNTSSDSNNWQEGIAEGRTRTRNASEKTALWEAENTQESYGVTYNRSESNNVGFSTSDGESWGWNMTEGTTDEESLDRVNELSGEASLSGTVTVNGSVSIPAVASVGGEVSTTAGVTVGTRAGTTRGERRSVRTDRGYSAGGSHGESRSFGSAVTDSAGGSIGGSYALTSTSIAERSMSNSDARSNSRTYSLGGSSTESEAVSEGMSDAEQQTWVESEAQTTLTSYSGFIPVGRFGVFYRQTLRMARKGYVRSYNLCGVSDVVAEMTFNEWTWAPELAIGDECGAELPPSRFPEAQCIVEPCDS